MPPAASRAWLGPALFAGLLAAALMTAILVVRARTPDLVLEVTRPSVEHPGRLSPQGARPRRVAITFFVREADPAASVGIVDRHESLVRTLDPAVSLAEREPVTYVWDGRTDAGTFAPPGRYRLRVELPSEDRVMIWPRRITLSGPSSAAANG